jgi:hypothetical protein
MRFQGQEKRTSTETLPESPVRGFLPLSGQNRMSSSKATTLKVMRTAFWLRMEPSISLSQPKGFLERFGGGLLPLFGFSSSLLPSPSQRTRCSTPMPLLCSLSKPEARCRM